MDLTKKDLSGVTYVDSKEELKALVSESLKKNDGGHLTAKQVHALLSRSRQRVPA